MTANGWFQIGLYLVILLAITKPMGIFMTRVFSGEKTFLDPVMRPIERLLYRMCGVDEKREMAAGPGYTIAMLLFSVVSMILLYVIERVQQVLPFNPQHMAKVAPDLAFNTAASFTTNTNWQNYAGESTMSYFHIDGRPCVPQFCLRCGRYCDRNCGGARNRAQGIQDNRQLLGGYDAMFPVDPRARFSGDRTGVRIAKNDPDLKPCVYVQHKLVNPPTVQTFRR